VLIYIAIGKIGAGSAVTILFMYPIVTVPLAWFLFGDRPTPLRWGVMAVISLGVIFTALPNISWEKLASGGAAGVVIAAIAGVAFAMYLILMQLGFRKLHPVPVSLLQFFTIFVLSAIILILLGPDLGVLVEADKRVGFIFGGILLGGLTLVGYLANNFGVRLMGAGLASIIASIGPVMTALLAWILIRDPLQGSQVFGIFLVTLGVGALSLERMKLQPKPKK
jgi:drug/metabolite transporter (DMT)-like permease